MTKDRVAGVFSLILGGAYLFGTFRITMHGAGDEIGPRAFPFIVATVVICCGLGLLLKDFRNTDHKPFSWRFVAERSVWIRILLTMVLGITYGLILDWLGYLIATFFFMLFVSSLINIGRYVQNIAIAAVFSIVTFTSFALILKLSLPRGILGSVLPF
ncbi:MAG: tripartite tricarboxylate transporter TctB family protein [Rhodospirillaceae bacterium]|nr:tripartite tricarboxylate transporter TctB family protein [Rhodospirillaceae bacterium]